MEFSTNSAFSVDKHTANIRKAVAVMARRLRDENGHYDIEACWAIGLLAAVTGMDSEELERASESYSRITFASWGDKKIAAIKIVRTYLGCGLREGKDIVEGKKHASAPASAAMAIKEECERDCGSNVIVRPWETTTVAPLTLGRGLDLSDEFDQDTSSCD